MRFKSGLLAAALTAAVVLSGSATVRADDEGKKAKPKGHPVRGTVVKVTPGEGDALGSFTIQVAVKKPQDSADAKPTAPVERTFQVTKDTQFEKQGKKKAVSAATFADLKPGMRVVVITTANGGQKVRIVGHAKKKKVPAP